MELTELTSEHDVPVLRVGGEVDMSTSAGLRDAVSALLQQRPSVVVVDLTDVTFFDSAGLKVLDEMQAQAQEAGASIALVCPQRRLVRLLEITGLDGRFPIHATPEGVIDAAASDG